MSIHAYAHARHAVSGHYAYSKHMDVAKFASFHDNNPVNAKKEVGRSKRKTVEVESGIVSQDPEAHFSDSVESGMRFKETLLGAYCVHLLDGASEFNLFRATISTKKALSTVSVKSSSQ